MEANLRPSVGGLPAEKRLRLWPGLVAAALLLLVRFLVPILMPGFEGFRIALLGGFLGTVAIVSWWLFGSRAPLSERWSAVLTSALVLVVIAYVSHVSMGIMWLLGCAVPLAALGLVAWGVIRRLLTNRHRSVAMIATWVLMSAPWTVLRMAGLTGSHTFEFAWRWTETREERLLARVGEPGKTSRARSEEAFPEVAWAGFRGPRRDGKVLGTWISRDWTEKPPLALWRRAIGPGWSSFAVAGDRLYTQEQRGDFEVVSSYDVTTGEPAWQHRDRTRFYEAMGGAGPRATPTVHADRVYALGATGILNVLDARDGAVVWTRNVADDTGQSIPIWGFAGSPWIADDLVVVAASGQLVAYELGTGKRRWLGPDGGHSYSSPQLLTIDGVQQILQLSDVGVCSVGVLDGALLWEYPWAGAALVQPAQGQGGQILVSAGEGKGVRRIDVARRPEGWEVEERWASNRLKPNFNDFVIHRGHAIGFDGRMLACIDLEDGARKWKGGRYGHGQLLLLADQDLLVVLTEKGELVLVEASTDHFRELARSPGIQGKTWNHPALVGDLLLVRNSEEMAAFRLGR